MFRYGYIGMSDRMMEERSGANVAFSLMILADTILLLWISAIRPQMFQMSTFYMALLIFTMVIYFLRSNGMELPLSVYGFKDEPWYDVGLGFLIGTIFSMPIIVGIGKVIVVQPTPLQTLFSILVVPFTEEIFFRGLVLASLQRYLPKEVAVLIQGFVFALYHYNAGMAVIPLFIMSIIIGYIVASRERIESAVISHMVYNFILYAISVGGGV